jgi:hypothetical protein
VTHSLVAARLMGHGFRSSLPQDRRARNDQMPGMFIIENGEVANIFQYVTIADNPLFLDLIIDPRRQSRRLSRPSCDFTDKIQSIVPCDKIDTALDPYKKFEKKTTIRRANSGFMCCIQSASSVNIEPTVPMTIQKRITVADVMENETTRRYFTLFCASGKYIV